MGKTSKKNSQTDAYDAYSADSCCDCTEAAENCVRPDQPCGPRLPYIWYPSRDEEKTEEYVRKLECEYACMQRSILTLTTHFARMQFRLRQILQATPQERCKLLRELEHLAFKGLTESDFGDEMPQIKHDLCALGEARCKQTYVIDKLRSRLTALADASPLEPFVYAKPSDCSGPKGKGGKKPKSRGSNKDISRDSVKSNKNISKQSSNMSVKK